MIEHCKGCGEELTNISPALSRYGHGDICSTCGSREAFAGDFIAQYAEPAALLAEYPADFLTAFSK